VSGDNIDDELLELELLELDELLELELLELDELLELLESS